MERLDWVRQVKTLESLTRVLENGFLYTDAMNRQVYLINLKTKELVNFRSEQKEKMQHIEDKQKEIYIENSSWKRSIKNEEQYREYQIWHVEAQETLDKLKQKKGRYRRCNASY